MGAWIETFPGSQVGAIWVVALYMGAWIETGGACHRRTPLVVALYMGAWIETEDAKRGLKKVVSHSIWVRGLKLVTYSLIARLMSRTLYGCVD